MTGPRSPVDFWDNLGRCGNGRPGIEIIELLCMLSKFIREGYTLKETPYRLILNKIQWKDLLRGLILGIGHPRDVKGIFSGPNFINNP